MLLLVCCLYKEVYLQNFKYMSFKLHSCCGEWDGLVHKPVNHTSWLAVVTPTDRPKSVCNRCVIELFCVAFYVLSLCPFNISVGIGALVITLPFLSFYKFQRDELINYLSFINEQAGPTLMSSTK